MEVKEPALAYGKLYTIAEYLEMENASAEKHEYYKGEVFAMSGATGKHVVVSDNLFGNLWSRLKGKPCKPYSSDLRVYIEKISLFTYPDVSVICGPRQSLNDDEMNFLNPSVIFEVASPGTTHYDRNSKFQLYREIPTLREYILVDTATVRIEAFFVNAGGNWELKEYRDIHDNVLLPTLELELPLGDIYEAVL